ncbi:hypothetical protein, partial [Salinivibrio socompensis]|uniref:hypothetical protein n=1 Tax=Salinivibrio socompensis TaxID=1510206 RepID=UPI00055DA05A
LGMVWRYSLFLAKEIITPYHAVQKTITKDQHALANCAGSKCDKPMACYKVASKGESTFC